MGIKVRNPQLITQLFTVSRCISCWRKIFSFCSGNKSWSAHWAVTVDSQPRENALLMEDVFAGHLPDLWLVQQEFVEADRALRGNMLVSDYKDSYLVEARLRHRRWPWSLEERTHYVVEIKLDFWDAGTGWRARRGRRRCTEDTQLWRRSYYACKIVCLMARWSAARASLPRLVRSYYLA